MESNSKSKYKNVQGFDQHDSLLMNGADGLSPEMTASP